MLHNMYIQIFQRRYITSLLIIMAFQTTVRELKLFINNLHLKTNSRTNEPDLDTRTYFCDNEVHLSIYYLERKRDKNVDIVDLKQISPSAHFPRRFLGKWELIDIKPKISLLFNN